MSSIDTKPKQLELGRMTSETTARRIISRTGDLTRHLGEIHNGPILRSSGCWIGR